MEKGNACGHSCHVDKNASCLSSRRAATCELHVDSASFLRTVLTRTRIAELLKHLICVMNRLIPEYASAKKCTAIAQATLLSKRRGQVLRIESGMTEAELHSLLLDKLSGAYAKAIYTVSSNVVSKHDSAAFRGEVLDTYTQRRHRYAWLEMS